MALGVCVLLFVGVFLEFVPSRFAQTSVRPLPQLPNQFITEVEANIVNKNRSVQITEYYDGPGARGRLETFSNGSRHTDIYDFKKQLHYHIEEEERSCEAEILSPANHNHNPFALFFGNGTAHIRSVADFFRFGAQYHDSYNGTGTARGIFCDMYVGYVQNSTMNYTMTWYFAARPTWNMPIGIESPNTDIPVRLVLEGTSENFNRTTQTFSSDTHTFYHVYEFVNFRLGAPDDHLHLFDPPHGIPCVGLPASKPIPKLPDQFVVEIQTAISPNETSLFYSVAYDKSRESTSYVYNYPSKNSTQGGVYGLHHIIHNFIEGTEYNISLVGCNMKKLTNETLGKDFVLDHGKITLASSNKLFGIPALNNATYEGEREIDGIAADLWMFTRNDIQLVPNGDVNQPSVWEYYFSKQTWHYTSLSLSELHQVPIRIEGHSLLPGMFDTYKFVSVMINFQPGPPRGFFFDNTVCFNSSSASSAQFTLPTIYDAVAGNYSVRGIVYKKMGQVMNISRSRFHVDFVPTASNQILVSVRVHSVPDVGFTEKLASLTSLATALDKLRSAVEKSELTVDFGKGPVTALRRSYSNTAVNSPKLSIPAVGNSDRSKKSGASSGTVAGVAIGTLILGIVLGGAIMYVVLRRLRSDSANAYKREIN